MDFCGLCGITRWLNQQSEWGLGSAHNLRMPHQPNHPPTPPPSAAAVAGGSAAAGGLGASAAGLSAVGAGGLLHAKFFNSFDKDAFDDDVL